MTPHVLDQLPLWIEGDLGAADTALIEGHLAGCPACQEAAEGLRTSQAWLREAMASPFGATDQDRLRRRVLDQLSAESSAPPIRRFAVRPAFLAACAASLLLATLVWRREPPRIASPPAAEPSHSSISTNLAGPAAAPALARQEALRTAPSRARPRPAEEPAPPAEGPSRIEFQTADPTIRIIWLAQARPLPEAIPSLQEAP